jgi:WD40 repeat protein
MSESCRQGIDAIVYSAEGDKIASADSSGHINVWSAQDGNRLYQYDEQIADIESLRFAENTLYVSTIPNRYMIHAEGFRVYKFNLHKKNDVTIVNPHPQTTFYVECVCLSPDSKRIAVGEWNLGNDNSHAVRMYNTTTGEMLLELMTESETGTRKVTFTPDGKFLVSLNSNQMLFVYDLQTGRRVHTHSALLAHDQPYISVNDVVAHGSMIAWGDSTGCVWQYDTKTGRTF